MISTVDPISASQGQAIDAITLSTDDDEDSISVSGLPEGLTFADKQISGTPTVSGLFEVTISATDSDGNAAEPVKVILTVDPSDDAVAEAIKQIDAAPAPVADSNDEDWTTGWAEPKNQLDPSTGETVEDPATVVRIFDADTLSASAITDVDGLKAESSASFAAPDGFDKDKPYLAVPNTDELKRIWLVRVASLVDKYGIGLDQAAKDALTSSVATRGSASPDPAGSRSPSSSQTAPETLRAGGQTHTTPLFAAG